MSEQTAPEPTMEEILASIRRIISDDDQAPEGAGEMALDQGWSAPAAADDAAVEDDVLELTEPVTAAAAPAAPPEPPPGADEPPARDERQGLVGGAAAGAAANAFGRLSAAAARPPAMAMPAPGRTLEDLTAELLRPLLKEWLDQNLAAIVQQRVDEEVERIARGRVR